MTAIPLIYNLFPRHFKTIDDWAGELAHAGSMKFNAVFINPFHMTGFSGSLYAVKDYYKLNPLFLKEGQDPSDFTPLEKFIKACRKARLQVIMDLVVNHTAFDSVLTQSHPSWYQRDKTGKLVSPYAIDPAHPENITVWGDLALIDNENSDDKEGLWKYWDAMVEFYQNMGILGFRCDAAYQVPSSLWKRLIHNAKKRYPESVFYAETLGCNLEQIKALGNVGFDYLFNSSKWWNFDKPWALEQHEINRQFAPSIAFPESHDTERLAGEKPGTVEVQKMRYALAAVFSKGLMMPMGFESGETIRMDVVKGAPADRSAPKWDISSWISAINALKLADPVLSEEGVWRALCEYRYPFLFLEKRNSKNESVYFCINKNLNSPTMVEEFLFPQEIKQCTRVIQLLADPFIEENVPHGFSLDPADIIMFRR